jgi:hypothetical protein
VVKVKGNNIVGVLSVEGSTKGVLWSALRNEPNKDQQVFVPENIIFERLSLLIIFEFKIGLSLHIQAPRMSYMKTRWN